MMDEMDKNCSKMSLKLVTIFQAVISSSFQMQVLQSEILLRFTQCTLPAFEFATMDSIGLSAVVLVWRLDNDGNSCCLLCSGWQLKMR